jgi:thioesterase domain-containing protein/acyl carrier protein
MANIDQLLLELSQRKVKLWLDGDRLRYKAPKEAFTPELLTQVKEYKADIITFLKEATNSTNTQLPPILPIERNENSPLSFAQQRLWFLHQFEPDSSSNNMPVIVKITGLLDINVLERSICEVVRRHEVLRTTFPSIKGKPQLVIAPAQFFNLPLIDLRDLSKDERDAKAFCLATEEARKPFDLAHELMLRVKLFCLEDTEHLLLWNLHCIVCDGASSDVFYQDLTTIYTAFVAGKPSPLSKPKVQYVDFAHWQRQWLQGEVLASQLSYWKQQLDNLPPALKLPFDRPHPKGVLTYQGDRAALMLPRTLNTELNRLSQKLDATLFMTLLTVFEILLYRYCQQEDILLSFASAGRGQVETERLIGFFSNTLMLRTNLTEKLTFKEALARVRQASLEAYAHQDLPFEKLIEELRPNIRQERSPLFQVKFALNPPWSEGRGMASVKLPDVTFTSLFGYIYHGKTKYDLTLVMREQDEGLGMVFDYNADIFNPSTIQKMLGHFHNLLQSIVKDPDCCLQDLPMLALGEELPQSDYDFSEAQDIELKTPHKLVSEILDDTEFKLIEIWQDVLGVDLIAIQDNFFELGGNSLLAVKTFAQIEEKFGKVLPLSILLKAPTVEQLATIIRQDEWSEAWSPLVEIQAEGSKSPLFCVHGGGFNVLIYRELAINLGSDYPVYGLQARALKHQRAWLEQIETIAQDYIQEIQKVQPKGPYLLAGLSNGGNIALEMAQQLKVQGHEVALLAMFDSYGPEGIKLLPPLPRFLSSVLYVLQYSIWRLIIKVIQRKSDLFKEINHQVGKLSNYNFKDTDKTAISAPKTSNLSNTDLLDDHLNFVERWMNQISLYIIEHSPWAFVSPSAQLKNMEDSVSKNLKALEEFYNKVHQIYTPKPYLGEIVLFFAKEFPPGYQRDPQLGWGKVAQKGVRKYKILGNHVSLMKSTVLAKVIRDFIDQSSSAEN